MLFPIRGYGASEVNTHHFRPLQVNMSEPRRVTRSTGARRRDTNQAEAQFWNTMPDPIQIKRGQAEAIQLARDAMHPDSNLTAGHGEAPQGAAAVALVVEVK